MCGARDRQVRILEGLLSVVQASISHHGDRQSAERGVGGEDGEGDTMPHLPRCYGEPLWLALHAQLLPRMHFAESCHQVGMPIV